MTDLPEAIRDELRSLPELPEWERTPSPWAPGQLVHGVVVPGEVRVGYARTGAHVRVGPRGWWLEPAPTTTADPVMIAELVERLEWARRDAAESGHVGGAQIRFARALDQLQRLLGA